jgi:hypothetical protein
MGAAATFRPTNDRTRVLSTNGAGPDLGLGDILRHDPAASNGTADMIVGPDGRPQLVAASAPLWWEEQEAAASAPLWWEEQEAKALAV